MAYNKDQRGAGGSAETSSGGDDSDLAADDASTSASTYASASASFNAGVEAEDQALEGALVRRDSAQAVPHGGYPMGPQHAAMMGAVQGGGIPPGWTPQAWYAAQQAAQHAAHQAAQHAAQQAALQWQQAGQMPQGWPMGMPPQAWPQGMPPAAWAQPGPPQGWPGMMPPPGYGQVPEGQGGVGPQPGWPQGGPQPYPGQVPQGGPQPYPGQMQQGMPYGWSMPPINVVVQNTQQNPQVVQQPQTSTVVQSAPGGASAASGVQPVMTPVMTPVMMVEPGQEVLVRTYARTRMKAVLLSFLFGWVGAQRFYLGQQWKGLLLLLLMVTPIPMFVGIWDGLRFLFMSDDAFDRLHNFTKIKDNRLLPPEGSGG